jgi:hypothetical protein
MLDEIAGWFRNKLTDGPAPAESIKPNFAPPDLGDGLLTPGRNAMSASIETEPSQVSLPAPVEVPAAKPVPEPTYQYESLEDWNRRMRIENGLKP